MKKAILFIISIMIFVSCKPKIESFLFDSNKVSERSHYYYEIKSGKLISAIEKTIILLPGLISDTIITKKVYEYNSRGLLSRIDTYYEQKPESEIFEYLPNDSLVYKKHITSEGDTILWEKYAYFPDGRKIIYHKEISLHASPDMDIKEIFKHKTYDTSVYNKEYAYADAICKSMKEYDKSNNLIRVVDFQYQNSRIIIETQYNIENNIQFMEKTRYYDYSKSKSIPDYYLLDSKNDTIGYNIHYFDKGKLILQIETDDYGKKAFKRFFENDRKIGEISLGNQLPYRIIDSYSYYPDGSLKEMLTYREKRNLR